MTITGIMHLSRFMMGVVLCVILKSGQTQLIENCSNIELCPNQALYVLKRWDENNNEYFCEQECGNCWAYSTQTELELKHFYSVLYRPDLPRTEIWGQCDCNAGYFGFLYLLDGFLGECYACPAGKYNPSMGSRSNTGCIDCVAGKYSTTEAATDERTCVSCDAGKYSAIPRASTCDECVIGKYSTATSTTCQSCFAGTYAADAGASFCQQCALGTYSSDGRSSCQACEVGKYASDCPAPVVIACSDMSRNVHNTSAPMIHYLSNYSDPEIGLVNDFGWWVNPDSGFLKYTSLELTTSGHLTIYFRMYQANYETTNQPHLNVYNAGTLMSDDDAWRNNIFTLRNMDELNKTRFDMWGIEECTSKHIYLDTAYRSWFSYYFYYDTESQETKIRVRNSSYSVVDDQALPNGWDCYLDKYDAIDFWIGFGHLKSGNILVSHFMASASHFDEPDEPDCSSYSECATCTDCAAGKYSTTEAATDVGTCVSCEVCDSNHYISGCNGTHPGVCFSCYDSLEECGEGMYLENCRGTSSGECKNCTCAEDEYNPSCGNFSQGQCTSCEPCPTNEYRSGCNGTEAGTCVPCQGCDSNHYRSGCNGTNPGVCVLCDTGEQNCDEGSYLTDCGTFSPRTCESCLTCLDGQYNSQCGNGTPGQCTSCGPCDEGEYRSDCYGTDAGVCVSCEICDSNSYRSGCTGANPGVCVSCYDRLKECREDTYLQNCGGNSGGECKDCTCTDGEYNPSCGNFSQGQCIPCTDCDEDEYRSGCTGANPGVCVSCYERLKECGENTYLQNCEGNSGGECKDCTCADGEYNPSCGNFSQGQCIPCTPCGEGKYRSGCTGVNPGNCASCHDRLKECGENTYLQNCGGNSGGECTDCTCANGEYNPSCGNLSQGECIPCAPCDIGKYRSRCSGKNEGECVACEGCAEGEVRVDCLPWSGKNDQAGNCVPENWATRTPTCPAAHDEVPLGLGGFNFRKVFNHLYDEGDFMCNKICSGAGRNDTGQCSGPHACNVHSCVMTMADQRFEGTKVHTKACPVALEDTVYKAQSGDSTALQTLDLKRGVACVNCDTCGNGGIAFRGQGGRDWGRGCARECTNFECELNEIWDWTAPIGQKCKKCTDLDNIKLCSSEDRDKLKLTGGSITGNVPFLKFSNCKAKKEKSIPTYGSCSWCKPQICTDGKRPVGCESCTTCALRGQIGVVGNGKFWNVSEDGLKEVVLPCQVGQCPANLHGMSRDGVLCVHDCDTQLTCSNRQTRLDCLHPHQARCVNDFPAKSDSRTKLARKVAAEANLLEPISAREQTLQFSFENVLVDVTTFRDYHYQCVYNSDSVGLVDGDKTPAGVLGRFREPDGNDRGERLCQPLDRLVGVVFPALPLQNTVTSDFDNAYRLMVDTPARVAAFSYTGLGYNNDPPHQKGIGAPYMGLSVPDTGNFYLNLDLRNASRAQLVITSAYQQDVLLTFLAADVTFPSQSQAITTSVDVRKIDIWSWIGKQTWNHEWVYSNIDTSTIGLLLLNISVPQSTVDAWGEKRCRDIVVDDKIMEFDSPVFVAFNDLATYNFELVVSSRPVSISTAEKSILKTWGLAGVPFVFGSPSSIAVFPFLNVLRYKWPHQPAQNFMLRHAAALDSGVFVLADYYRVVGPDSNAIVEFNRKRRVVGVILFSDRVVVLSEHDNYVAYQTNITMYNMTTKASAFFNHNLSMLVAATAVDPYTTLVATLEESTIQNGYTVLGLFTRSFETASVQERVGVVPEFMSTKTTRSRSTAAYFQFCRVVVLATERASWDAAAACVLPDDTSTNNLLKLHVVSTKGATSELELPRNDPRSVGFISMASDGHRKLWVGWHGNVYVFSVVDGSISMMDNSILKQMHFVSVRGGFLTMTISKVTSEDPICGTGYQQVDVVVLNNSSALDSAKIHDITRCAAWCSAVSRCGAFEFNEVSFDCALFESVPLSKRSEHAHICFKTLAATSLMPEMYSMSSKEAGSDALYAVPAGSMFSIARSSVVNQLTLDEASRGSVVYFAMADSWPQALRMKRLAHYVYKKHTRPMAKPMLDADTPLYMWNRWFTAHRSLGSYPFYLRLEDDGKADAVGLPDVVMTCEKVTCEPNPMAGALRLEVALACPEGREFSLLLVSIMPGSRAQVHRSAQSSLNLTAPSNTTSRAEYVLVYHRKGRVRVGIGTWFETDLSATMTLFLGARVDAVVFVDVEPTMSTVAAFAQHKDVRIDKKETVLSAKWQLVHRRLSYMDKQHIIEIGFSNPTPTIPRAVAVDAVQLLTVLTDPPVERHGEFFVEVKTEKGSLRVNSERHRSAIWGGNGVGWHRVHATVYSWAAGGCSTLDVHVANLTDEDLDRTSFLETKLSRLGCSMALEENGAGVFGSCDLELPLDAGRLMLRAYGCDSVSDLLATVSPGHTLYQCSKEMYWDFRRKICRECDNAPNLCPVGQHVPGCAILMANASKSCVDCDASPEVFAGRANWTGDGCGWVCRVGYWQNGFSCLPCSSAVCMPGERLEACTLTADSLCKPCPGGIAANEEWVPESSECVRRCKEGFWRNEDFCLPCSSIGEKRLAMALSGETSGFFRFQKCQPDTDTKEVRCTGTPNATILSDALVVNEDCLISCVYGMRVVEYQHSMSGDHGNESWTLRRCAPCQAPLGIDGHNIPEYAFVWKDECAVDCVLPFVRREPHDRCVLCDGSSCAVGEYPTGPNCSCVPCQRLRPEAHFNFTTHGQVDDPFSCNEKCTGDRYDRLGLGECVPYGPIPHCLPGQFLSPRSATNDASCKQCHSCEGALKISECNNTHDAHCVPCGVAPQNAWWNGTDCSTVCKPGFQRKSVHAPCEICTNVCAPGTYALASRYDCYECKECTALPPNATWVSECTWECADGFVLSASQTCDILYSPLLTTVQRQAKIHRRISCDLGYRLSEDFSCVPCPGPTPEDTTLWEWTTGKPCEWTCTGLAYKTLRQNKSFCKTYNATSRAGTQRLSQFVSCVAVLISLVTSHW